MSDHVWSTDPQLQSILDNEHLRQRESIVLIPSENYTSKAVLEGLGSIYHNHQTQTQTQNQEKNAVIELCEQRALSAYNLDPSEWGVAVDPLSGSPANFYVYYALLSVNDRIMSLDLPHGGHLSHGYQTPTKKISAVSKYWQVLPYRLNESSGQIDYQTLHQTSKIYRPKLIVSGASAYSRHFDFEKLRQICNDSQSIFLFDMAHISGLIAGQAHPSPFEFADIVTTTTHKSLRGPRAAMIFFRRGPIPISASATTKKKTAAATKTKTKSGEISISVAPVYEFEDKIRRAISDNQTEHATCLHTITALATALKHAQSSVFSEYQFRVVENSASFVGELQRLGYTIVSGGTDNHLALIDLRVLGIGGAQVEKICELCNIALNKNTVPGDKSAMNPGGIRVGTPAMTTRGCHNRHFEVVAGFIHEAVHIALAIQEGIGGNKMKQFNQYLNDNKGGDTTDNMQRIQELKLKVVQFSMQFPLIGVDQLVV
jgi:glycine hydroxymethyltransferase